MRSDKKARARSFAAHGSTAIGSTPRSVPFPVPPLGMLQAPDKISRIAIEEFFTGRYLAEQS